MFRRFFGSLKMGECICFRVLGPWTVGDGKIKASKEERPSGLSGIQALGISKIFEVAMVSENFKRMMGPFELVSPFLQSELDSQELPIADIIVLLHRG